MHSIGDMVVYGAGGVMKIVDIRDIEIADTVRSYYVLKEVGSQSPSETLIPTDNGELVGQMRPLLTRDEMLDVIRQAKRTPEREWIEDNRVRSEHFKKILSSGDRLEIIMMINSIYNAGIRRSEEGKKNFLSDENVMRKAEKLLYSEISIVMNIPIEEVPAFIESV